MNNRKNGSAGFGGALIRVFATAALMLGVVAEQQAVAAPTTGIYVTRHNLGTGNGISGANKFGGTDEVCVFCHTPHGSNTAAPAPLWNKALGSPTGGTYNVYNSNSAIATSTMDGAVAAVGSVSLACLSCHDGTQAMDNMINKPGSGLDGAMASGSGWTGDDQTSGKLKTSVAANLGGANGNDLTNDHPIGMPYCGGKSGGGAYNAVYTCLDLDFEAPKYVNGKWFVDTAGYNGNGGTANVKEKTDMILYVRADDVNATPRVECASCHDPHVEAKTDSAGGQVAFLRVSQKESGVCLACHTK